MDKKRIIKYCNKVIEISLYLIAFYIPISNAIIESSICLAITAWLIKKFINKTKFRNIFPHTFLNIPILFYVLICFASIILSTNKTVSFAHFIFKTIEYLLLFFIVVEIVDKKILRNILVVLVFSVGLVGIDGIFQYFTKFDFLRNRIKAFPDNINGPFKTPNDFSNYIISLLPLVSSLAFLRFKKLWIRLTLIVISLILFTCVVLAMSRSGWIALLLATIFVLILGNRRLFIFSLLLITIALSLFPWLPYRAQSRIMHFFEFTEAGHSTHRQFLWNIGLKMVQDRPILGQGLGTFMENFLRFQPKEYPMGWGISYAHNCFLQIASETGILGLLSFISIITVLFFVSFKILMRIKRDHFYYYILSGFLISLFAYLVGSFFDTNLYSLALAVLFWFMMGLTVGITKIITLESNKLDTAA